MRRWQEHAHTATDHSGQLQQDVTLPCDIHADTTHTTTNTKQNAPPRVNAATRCSHATPSSARLITCPHQPCNATPTPLATSHIILHLGPPRNANPMPLVTAHSSLRSYMPRNATPNPLASTDAERLLTTRRQPPRNDTSTLLATCLGDFPVNRCVYTEQLRTQANIPDPVTHVSETTEPHTPPLLDSQGQLTNQGSIESQWEDLEKVELISLVEKLTEEASRSNIKIKSLQQDRDLIIQHREVFASALRVADRLISSKQRSEYWRRWWSSGRPQHLRHTIRSSPPLDITPTTTAATETDTTPTITSITTAATGTDTTPPVIHTITAATETDTTPTSPVTIPTVTNNTTTAQSDTEETNPNSAGPATSPEPPPVASSTPTTRKRGGKRREEGKTRNPSQQQQGRKSRYHTTNQHNTTQRPKQAPVKVCEYCKRRGHTVGDCHHRTADQRQERLLRQIMAEGRHSDPPSPLQHLFSQIYLFSQICHNLDHPFHSLTPGDRTRVCSGSLQTSILTLPPHTNDTTP
ncbi:hypothetical protein Pcinc_011447 [Petrolisthes cinctipes]|uniref:Uncharacterized protein n=1 Tax=Petrolisthes cinctipes TaxID=88211 RepID=A0AAE1G3L7_PETCI|nr:hypothetical protein Pcinc_011447 [Petrolisthes cinctipes]